MQKQRKRVNREATFVHSARIRATPSNNAHWYGDAASAANIFAYVGGNPLSHVDQRGLDAICGPGQSAVPKGSPYVVTCVPDDQAPDKRVCATAECAAGVLPVRQASPAACFATCFSIKTGVGLALGGAAGKLAFSIGPRVGAMTELVMSSKTSLTVSEILGIDYCAKECNVKIDLKSNSGDVCPEPMDINPYLGP